MKKTIPLAGAAALVIIISSRTAISAGQSGALVRLQASTPGIAQNGHINVTGTVLGGGFGGDGSALLNLNATNLTAGTVNDARIPNNIVRTGQAQTITGNKTFSGSNSFTNATVPFAVTSTNVVVNLNADLLDGLTSAAFALASHSHDGADIVSGMVPDARLNSNIVRTGSNQTISGNKTLSGTTSFTNASVPFLVTSANLVTNLNADLLDGLSSSDFVLNQVPLVFSGSVVDPILSLTQAGTGRGVSISSGSGTAAYLVSNAGRAIEAWGNSNGYAATITQVHPDGHGLRSQGGNGYGVYASGSTGVIASGSAYGLQASSSATSASAVFAQSTGSGSYGLKAEGALVGVSAFSTAAGSRAIEARTTSANSFGVWSEVQGSGSAAIMASSNSTNGVGLFAQALGTGGTAILAGANSGIAGDFQSTSGTALAAYSTSGIALDAGSTNNDGIVTSTSAANKSAIYADNSSTSGATAFGIYASSTRAGTYGGYFVGNVHVIGTLSKAGGAFMIDHPQDPEGSFLTHSFVESPDMKNIYDGTIVTDAKGYATVTLPDYFDSLNDSFRYQLTVLDGGEDSEEWVMARIARKIQNNQFVIRTSAPNVEVSWMVTGIRRDRWAQRNRIVPERPKSEDERGYYLNPDVYDQPEARRLYGRNWLKLQDSKQVKK